jgi:ubiquinone/menaquinone biosynthesis C-methylase UbiE
MNGQGEVKAAQAQQWRSRSAVRLERAELIERHWAPITRELLAQAGVSAGAHVLDVGTGHGEPALTAARVVGSRGRVVGVDLSPEMIEVAKIRAHHSVGDFVEWRVDDAERLDLTDASFDAVLCRNSLMFVPDPELAVRRMLAVLRPGGTAAVAVVGPEPTQEQWTMTVDAIVTSLGVPRPPAGAVGEPGVYSVSDAALLERLFSRAGFGAVEVTAQRLVYDFHRPQEVVEWHEINPTIMGLFEGQSQDAADAAWRAVVDAARERADVDGHVRIPSEILYARGRRPGS